MNEFYVRSKSVVCRRVGDDTLVVPVRRGVGDLASIFSLNEVASAIWTALEQPASIDTLVSGIVKQFEVRSSEAERDVKSFLTQLDSAGLVEIPNVEEIPSASHDAALLQSGVA